MVLRIRSLNNSEKPNTGDSIYIEITSVFEVHENNSPGSRGPLLTPSPLRALRETFTSQGSSPSKTNLCIEMTR